MEFQKEHIHLPKPQHHETPIFVTSSRSSRSTMATEKETEPFIMEMLDSFRSSLDSSEKSRLQLGGARYKSDDDQFVLRFLRCTNFEVERSLALFKAYWRLYDALCIFEARSDVRQTALFRLTSFTDAYAKKLISPLDHKTSPFESRKVTDCLRSGWIQIPPSRDRNNRAVVFVYPRKFDPTRYQSSDICASILKIVDSLLEDEENQLYGISIVIDVTGSAADNINFGTFKKVVALLQHCVPIQVGSVIVIGLPYYLKALWKLTSPVMNPSLKKKIKLLYGSDDTEKVGFKLEEFIDLKNIPEHYHGLMKWDVDESMQEWVAHEYL